MVDSSAIYVALGTICQCSCSKCGKPWRTTFLPAVGPHGRREAACYGSSFREASTPSECISLLLRSVSVWRLGPYSQLSEATQILFALISLTRGRKRWTTPLRPWVH